MSDNNFDVGVAEVLDLYITNADGSKKIGLLGQIDSISIFESIDRPFMDIEILVADGINIVETFPILGEEFLTISVRNKGPKEKPVNYEFFMYQIDSVVSDENSKMQMFAYKGKSREAFLESSTSLYKSYNTSFDAIVEDVYKSILKTKKQTFVSKTKGSQKIVTPYFSPSELLEFCRNKAVSPDYISSSFVGFENKKGFNFVTIEELFHKKQVEYTYKYKVLTDSLQDRDSLFSIINFYVYERNNSYRMITNGAFKNFALEFDFITKTTNKYTFDYSFYKDKFKIFKDPLTSFPQNDNFVKQVATTPGDGYFVVKDSTKPSTFEAESKGLRRAFASLVNQHNVEMLVNGNFDLNVGDLVELQVPKMDSINNDKQLLDKFVSGKYLVSSIRHMLNVSSKIGHTMSVELIKGTIRVGPK